MASVPLFGSEMLRPKYSYLLKWGQAKGGCFDGNGFAHNRSNSLVGHTLA